MQRVSECIIRFRWVFAILFLALIIFSIFMIPKTNITYDLSAYVPKGGQTEKSLQILKDEFDDKGSVNVMIDNLSLEEATIAQSDMAKITGVGAVVFEPNENYRNSKALYTIILEDYDSSEEANATITRILDYLSSKDAYMSGVSAVTYFTRKAIEEEVVIAAIIIVTLIFAILLFTSRTYFELLIMLLVFGVAAVIHLGTNFLLGEIAFLSNVIGLILQLVLTIDYSVILLHRFMEECKEHSPQESMIISLSKGISEILSSSLTTIAGMAALMLMSLPIGIELGMILAKGIAISLITVIFLMPFLLILCSKLIERTKHRAFIPSVEKPAKKILSARRAIVSIFAVVVILAFVGQFLSGFSFNINGTKNIIIADEKIAKNFGTTNTLVIIIPKEDAEKEEELIEYMLEQPLINKATSLNTLEIAPGIRLTDELTAAEFSAISQDLGMPVNLTIIENLFKSYIQKNDHENDIPIDEYRVPLIDFMSFVYENSRAILPKDIASQLSQLILTRENFESENYIRIMFNIDGPVEGAQTFETIQTIENDLGKVVEHFYLVGESVAMYEMQSAFPKDNLKVVLLTALFILIILFVNFRNFLIPFILILTIQGSVWINFAIPALTGIPTNYIGYLVITAIQMGATIDYAIILTNRYLTYNKRILDKKEAMSASVNAVFPTILTSGSILSLTGFVLGLATNEPTISSLGMLLGIGASLSLFMVLFVLPSFLLSCDKLIAKADFRTAKQINKV